MASSTTDGSPTLRDVANHHDSCKSLGLDAAEKSDLVQFLGRCRTTVMSMFARTAGLSCNNVGAAERPLPLLVVGPSQSGRIVFRAEGRKSNVAVDQRVPFGIGSAAK